MHSATTVHTVHRKPNFVSRSTIQLIAGLSTNSGALLSFLLHNDIAERDTCYRNRVCLYVHLSVTLMVHVITSKCVISYS